MTRQASYLQLFARVGYASRGLVFVVLAYFTALAVIDARVRPVDSKDALRALLLQPIGTALLSFIAAGLMCFALWRWAEAFLDTDQCGADQKGIARRMVYAAAGLFYAAFASLAISMAAGGHTTKTERVVHDWTAWAFTQPFGRWVVGLAGAAIVIAALCIGIAGIRAEFKSRLELKEKTRWFVTLLGCAGYLTRAVVFAIIGVFVLFAAIDSNARSHWARGSTSSHQGSTLRRAVTWGDGSGVFGIRDLRPCGSVLPSNQ